MKKQSNKKSKVSVIVRLDKDLLKILTSKAQAAGLSRNAYICYLLSLAGECSRKEKQISFRSYLSDLLFVQEILNNEEK